MLVKCSILSLHATHTHFSSNQKTLPKLMSNSGQGGKASPNFRLPSLHCTNGFTLLCPSQQEPPAAKCSHTVDANITPSILPQWVWGQKCIYSPVGICTTTEKNLQFTNMCSNISPWITQKGKETPGPCEMNVYYTRPSFMTVHIKRV